MWPPRYFPFSKHQIFYIWLLYLCITPREVLPNQLVTGSRYFLLWSSFLRVSEGLARRFTWVSTLGRLFFRGFLFKLITSKLDSLFSWRGGMISVCSTPWILSFLPLGDMHFHREFKGVSTDTAIFIGQYKPGHLIFLVFLPCHSATAFLGSLWVMGTIHSKYPFSCKEYMAWRKCRKRKAPGPGKCIADFFEILLLSSL